MTKAHALISSFAGPVYGAGGLHHLTSLNILVLLVLKFMEHLVESTILAVMGSRILFPSLHQLYCKFPASGLLIPTCTNSAATSSPRAALTAILSFPIKE